MKNGGKYPSNKFNNNNKNLISADILEERVQICGFLFELDQKMITKSNILSENRVPYISNRFY